MVAAPCATRLAFSNSARAFSAVASRKNHQMVEVLGMTLGWSPPLVMTRWLRWDGSRCSRSLSQPISISTTASSASRAVQGEVAAWALSPLKVNSAEMRAYCRRP